MPSNNRKLNYKALRQAGYTYIEATKYKDLSVSKVNELIDKKAFKVGDKVRTSMLDGLTGKVVKVYGDIIKVQFVTNNTDIDLKAKASEFEKVGG